MNEKSVSVEKPDTFRSVTKPTAISAWKIVATPDTDRLTALIWLKNVSPLTVRSPPTNTSPSKVPKPPWTYRSLRMNTSSPPKPRVVIPASN